MNPPPEPPLQKPTTINNVPAGTTHTTNDTSPNEPHRNHPVGLLNTATIGTNNAAPIGVLSAGQHLTRQPNSSERGNHP
jgi:hypothetical protein